MWEGITGLAESLQIFGDMENLVRQVEYYCIISFCVPDDGALPGAE